MQVSDEIGCLDIVLFNLCKLSVRICTRSFGLGTREVHLINAASRECQCRIVARRTNRTD